MIINGDLRYKQTVIVTPASQRPLRTKKAFSLLKIIQLEKSPNRAKLLSVKKVMINRTENNIKKRRARMSDKKNDLAISVLKK
jgi:hypothetical protein